MDALQETAATATPSYNYDSLGSSTTSSGTAYYTGSAEYPVFPNAVYISKFYLTSSQYSGLTDLDIDLYNECYLPARALSHHDPVKRDNEISKPDYQLDEPPCKRQAAINANCHFRNTNGTFAGLETYSGDWDVQQHCYCDIYPFFDSATGCQKCFEEHGGIEGYHWFPETYLSAVSSSYCSANPQTTGFYPFVVEFAKSDSAADIPSTTASDILGTQTAASLYYTYAAATDVNESTKESLSVKTRLSLWRILLAAVPLSLMLY